MLRIIAIAALAASVTACNTTGGSDMYRVATGVDARGNVIWETLHTGPVRNITPSTDYVTPCWNKECI